MEVKKNIINNFNFQIELTSACNHKCIHCYRHWKPESVEDTFMTQKTFDAIIESILNNSTYSEVPFFVLTGGEPLLHRELLIYATERLSEKGAIFGINTNFSIENKILKDVLYQVQNKALSFFVGLPSINRITYEKITNGNDYDNLLINLKMLADSGMRNTINMVVTKENISDIIPSVKKLSMMGLIRFKITRVQDVYKNDWDLSLVPSDEEIIRLYEKIFEMDAKKIIHFEGTGACFPMCLFPDDAKYAQLCSGCGGGKSSFAINPLGKIRPCTAVNDDFSKGDLNVDKFIDIIDRFNDWSNPNLFQECINCDTYKEKICTGGCRIPSIIRKENINPQNIGNLNVVIDDKNNIGKPMPNVINGFKYSMSERKNKCFGNARE